MCSHQGCLVSHAIHIVDYGPMGGLLQRRSCILSHVVSCRLLDRIQRAPWSWQSSLLLRVILRLLHAQGILFLGIMTVQNLCVIQVGLLGHVARAA